MRSLPAVTQRCSIPNFNRKKEELDVFPRFPRRMGREFPKSNLLFFSAGGQLMAASKNAGLLGIWETDSGRAVGEVASPLIFGGVFAPDGRTVALDHGDGTVTVWEVGRCGDVAWTIGDKKAWIPPNPT